MLHNAKVQGHLQQLVNDGEVQLKNDSGSLRILNQLFIHRLYKIRSTILVPNLSCTVQAGNSKESIVSNVIQISNFDVSRDLYHVIEHRYLARDNKAKIKTV